MERTEILARLRAQTEQAVPVVGVCAGVGLTAKCSEKGGADLIFINNAGRFRMAGRSTLLAKFSFGDANAVTEQMVYECLPVIRETPAIAGVFAQDPFKNTELILERLRRLGVSGIQNSPSLGMMRPAMAKNLEAGLMGMSMEFELIRKAHGMGFLTAPLVYSPEHVGSFIEAGADILVVTAGVTVGRDDGVPFPSAEDNFRLFSQIAQAAKTAKPDIFVLAHGGVLADPETVQRAFDTVPELDGFVGGSAVERIPVESAIRDTIRAFKKVGCEEDAV